MRPSALRLGKAFGKMGKIYGEYRFAISPYEQSAWKQFFYGATVKVFNRYIYDNWLYFGPPLLGAYLIIDWANKENYRISRKNPADYENDE